MFEIELDIFSGRPNPRWTLDPADHATLLDRLVDRSVPLAPMVLTASKLGYRGFVIRATGSAAAALRAQGLPTEFRVRDQDAVVGFEAEQWLLFTGDETRVERPVRDAVEQDLASAVCKRPYHTSSTNFREWNRGLVCYRNNCYNYGSNWRTDTYAQPGRGSGTGLSEITIAEVLRCAESDGYVDHCVGRKNRNLKVWFCVWPGVDYHWYRQTEPMDGEERWCHKMGTSPARNTDDSGQFISDPRAADRSEYVDEGIFLYCGGRSNKTVI